MSPERKRTVRIAATTAPSAARLGSGDLEAATARAFQRREDEAYARGLEAGRRAAHLELGQGFEAALERLDASRDAALERINHTSIELALGIARQLLRAELPTERYDLEGIVRSTLAFSESGRGPCVVHVHPADAERLADVPFRAGTKIEADTGVPQGSVHVTTPHGLLVRDLDEALRSIGERLTEGLG